MRIYKTTNYSMFKFIKGNRVIYSGHIKKIIRSIEEENLLEINPIVVNEHYEVIDGQHRLEVAKTLNLPIYYLIKEGAGIKQARLDNTNTKSWTLYDYLDSYIRLGKKEYEVLALFCETYGLPITLGIGLLLDVESNIGGNSTDTFKSGDFKIKNVQKAQSIAEKLMDFKPYSESGVYRSKGFVYAVRKIIQLPEYNHKQMLLKLKQMKGKLKHEASIKNYLRVLEDIYNYRQHTVLRFI